MCRQRRALTVQPGVLESESKRYHRLFQVKGLEVINHSTMTLQFRSIFHASLVVGLLICNPASSFHVHGRSSKVKSELEGRNIHLFKHPGSRPRISASPSRLRLAKDETEADDPNRLQSTGSWLFTLVLPLLFVYISNQWSRSSLYYLVNFSDDADPFLAMNADIGFSQAQYGFLASLAFTALFGVASLGAGIASDRFDRKLLTTLSAAGWAAASLGTSLSTSYSDVVLWRVAMGLACAFTTPTAYTLINERVPKDRISFATSLYGTGVAFGGALASLSILLDNEFGWQKAMTIISIVGFGSSGLSALLLPSDTKQEQQNNDMQIIDVSADEDENTPLLNDIGEAFSTTRAKWIYLGSFLRFSSGLCIGVWSAPYFRMAFPDNAADYAVAQAAITAIAGSASGLLGGAAADWLSQNIEQEDKLGPRLFVPVVGSLLAAPAWYFAMHTSDSFETAMAWLAAEYFVAECWFGPTISSLLGTVDKKVTGTAQGLFTMTGAIANLSPTLLGFIYGQATGAETSSELVDLLSTGVCFGYVSCALCFAMSAQSPPEGKEAV
jgi:MFS family permease